MELSSDVITWEHHQHRHDPTTTAVSDSCRSLLRAGWWLGKRLAIAGAALTSAPFVAPPLLVLSTIGLVCSLPFTLLFLGYAATSKVVGYFLNPPATHFLLKGPVDEERFDLGEVGGVGEEDEGKVFDEMPVGDGVYPYEGGGVPVEKEPEMEDRGVVIEEVDVVEEPESGSEVEVVDAMGVEKVEVPVKVAAAVVYPEVALEVVEEGALVGQTELGGEYEPEIVKQLVPTVVEVNVEEVQGKEVETVEVHLPNEENLYTMDKVWEEIDALRLIVGYTATRLASSVEELKALYKFTGVEPPKSLEESPDLAELRSRLQVLKSVIGVK